jgi:proline iminopeptidase
MSIRRALYPEIEPRLTGTLPLDHGHTMYFECSGKNGGIPVVALHGGPGGASSPVMRRFFNPDKWDITLFDQRGCGQSQPHASLEANTTWDLVADIERLREHLGIEKWAVFGGSWGSTLSLAYAIAHPERVTHLILRGIFLIGPEELNWFYQDGASRLFPDAWEGFLAPIPDAERGDLVHAYYKRLTSNDAAVRKAAARGWSQWEGDTISFDGPSSRSDKFENDAYVDAFARIECHYFVNKGFFDRPDWWRMGLDRIRHIPGWIVQARYDAVTPMATAWALHKAWPEAHFHIVPDAGHAATDPGVIDGLVRATDAALGQL